MWSAVREVVPTVEQTGIDEGYLDLGEVAADFLAAREVAEAVQAAVRGVNGADVLARRRHVQGRGEGRLRPAEARRPDGRPSRAARRRSSRRSTSACSPVSGRAPRSGCARRRSRRSATSPRSTTARSAGCSPARSGRCSATARTGSTSAGWRRRSSGSRSRPKRRSSATSPTSSSFTPSCGGWPAQLAAHLTKKGQAARTVTTKVRYPDFSIRSRSSTLAAGLDDGAAIGEIACTLLDRALADRPGPLQPRRRRPLEHRDVPPARARLVSGGGGAPRRGRRPRPPARPRRAAWPAISAYTCANASNSAGIEPGVRLRGADLVHLADVAAGLGRRPRDPPPRACCGLTQVGEDVLEHAVVVGRAQRLDQERGRALVDRRRAHLHSRGRADLLADDDQPQAVETQRRDLAGRVAPRGRSSSSPGASTAAAGRRSSRPRRGRAARGLGRDGVQVGDRRAPRKAGGDALGLRRAGRSRGRRRPPPRRRRRPGRNSSPASAASRALRSLRPSRVATTRAPPRSSAPPTALPIAPGTDDPDGRHEASLGCGGPAGRCRGRA